MFPRLILGAALMLVSGAIAIGQEMQFPGPEPEHAFLQKFVGTWASDAECYMGPDQPAVKTKSKITSRMIGPFWLVSEIKSESMGTKVTAIQTIGYDPEKKKYVGTWIDSMFGYLWHYEGTVDESGKKLVLEAAGPNFVTGKGTSKYRDVYEFKAEDQIAATSYMQDENEKWVEFVKGNTKRVAGGKTAKDKTAKEKTGKAKPAKAGK